MVIPDDFIRPGSRILRRHSKYVTQSSAFRWRATFGASPHICVDLWLRVSPHAGYMFVHLLWALMLMKLYCSEPVMCAIAAENGNAPDEKTFRKWAGLFIDEISRLAANVILWGNRLRGDPGNVVHVTVDGTDFCILEPRPFCSGWFSHKFKGPGMRYEVGISIQEGDIVWIIGPFPCGFYSDLRIFREYLSHMLDDGEMVIADNGYNGEPTKILTPFSLAGDEEQKELAATLRARHETCNRRFKTWGCLGQRFRHDTMRHYAFFSAVAVIEQLKIEGGEKLFEVNPQWMI